MNLKKYFFSNLLTGTFLVTSIAHATLEQLEMNTVRSHVKSNIFLEELSDNTYENLLEVIEEENNYKKNIKATYDKYTQNYYQLEKESDDYFNNEMDKYPENGPYFINDKSVSYLDLWDYVKKQAEEKIKLKQEQILQEKENLKKEKIIIEKEFEQRKKVLRDTIEKIGNEGPSFSVSQPTKDSPVRAKARNNPANLFSKAQKITNRSIIVSDNNHVKEEVEFQNKKETKKNDKKLINSVEPDPLTIKFNTLNRNEPAIPKANDLRTSFFQKTWTKIINTVSKIFTPLSNLFG